jgi:hypothetical protein
MKASVALFRLQGSYRSPLLVGSLLQRFAAFEHEFCRTIVTTIVQHERKLEDGA